MTLHHLYLLAPGATSEEVRRFYGDALGLLERQTPDSLSHVSVLWFSAGTAIIHVGYPAEGQIGAGHTALSTESVDDARARFLAGGYAVDDALIPMGYPRFMVRDPWGNQFEILPAGLP